MNKIKCNINPADYGLINLQKNIIQACQGHLAIASNLT